MEYLEIGIIINTHGVKGEVKVLPLTDDPARFKKLQWVLLDHEQTLKKLEIEKVKFFKNTVILKLKGIDTLETADQLKNCYLKVDREHAVKLPKDSYFICDLIGSEVYEMGGNKLGELKDVLKTGSNDVYVVGNGAGKEILIPALKSVVKKVEPDQKRIEVILPEGLLDDEV